MSAAGGRGRTTAPYGRQWPGAAPHGRDDESRGARGRRTARPGRAARRLAALLPNLTTVDAIKAAQRGEVAELGIPAEAIAELDCDD